MRPAILLAALLAALIVPSALAGPPEREGTVSATAANYEWDGGPLAGGGDPDSSRGEACALPQCDGTLIKVDIPAGQTGKLKIDIGDFGQMDLELYVYTSDATGKPIKQLGASTGAPGAPETYIVSKASAGYYLVQVTSYIAAGTLYKGKANLSGVAAGAPTLPPGTAPPGGGDTLPTAGTLTANVSVLPGKPKDISKKGVGLKFDCSVQCKGSVSLVVSAKDAKKAKLGKKKITIGKAKVAVTKRNQLVTIKLSKKYAKKIAKAKSLRVSLTGKVTDNSGNQGKSVKASGTFKR